jgi:hypothetical protein
LSLAASSWALFSVLFSLNNVSGTPSEIQRRVLQILSVAMVCTSNPSIDLLFCIMAIQRLFDSLVLVNVHAVSLNCESTFYSRFTYLSVWHCPYCGRIIKNIACLFF